MSKKEKKPLRKNRWFWVRLGDMDDYSRFDGLDEVADYLVEFRITVLNKLGNKYFFHALGYPLISMFWGDDDANPTRELTYGERYDLQQELDKR